MLTGFQGQPLVAHILQGDNFPSYIILGQLLSGNVLF